MFEHLNRFRFQSVYVAPLELPALLLVPVLLGAVALLACYGPIRRSGFSDPWAELRKTD